MLSLQRAARLLAAADSPAGLAALATALGFPAPPLPVDGELAAAIGLPPEAAEVAVVRGPGLLRLLLVRATGPTPLRDTVERIARRLAARAPHPLWCLAVTHDSAPHLVLATWAGDRFPPRIAALAADRTRLVDSDLETLRALAASPAADDLRTHSAWLDILGRGSLTRRFYRELESTVGNLADALEPRGARLHATDRRELALLHTSRLLFLAFVQAKGWLDGDAAFLTHGFTRCMDAGGGYHGRVLLPLFFGTLNTPPHRRAAAARALGRVPFLNGGLFARTPLERRAGPARFPDCALAPLFDRLLARYRFTAREDQLTWSEAAVDPEMLGHAFESLMDGGARRSSGAFYTPQPLVAHVTGLGLTTALAGGEISASDVEHALRGHPIPAALAPELRRRARALRVLDPACGSGAFLVHTLETLSTLLGRAGDRRTTATRRRDLLASSIFGVDVNPTAIWLCELRLWLSTVIDCRESDPLRVAPLPNLDRNIRVGDALLGGGLSMTPGSAPTIAPLRRRYARATGATKHALARRLEREERLAALRDLDARLASAAARRHDLLAAARGADLFGARRGLTPDERRHLDALRTNARALRDRRRAVAAGAGLPFAFRTHFADVTESGFHLVLGNPPWVRPHHLPPRDRQSLRGEFACLRDPAWAAGALAGGSGPGFAAQTDLAAPFVERALSLLAPSGTLALIVPTKLWRALAGGGIRRLLTHQATVHRLEDWTRSRHTFDAAVYPSVLTASRSPKPPTPTPDPDRHEITVTEERGADRRCWSTPATHLRYDDDPASPWLLAPPAARAAFDRLSAAGSPLAHSSLGRPLLGVKCGLNEAFMVEPHTTGHATLAPLLRPLLRGATLQPWRTPHDLDATRLLWTHDDAGDPLLELPPAALRHLAPFRPALRRRTDSRDSLPWWSLFRTEAALADRPRVVWADIGRSPRATLLPAGDPTVPLNSCYAIRCACHTDALALVALLNSPVAAAWLALLAEPARGGYHRYLAWTVGLLPIPHSWHSARHELAALATDAWNDRPPHDHELTAAVCSAYGIAPSAIEPLLEWTAR